jgi:hypothetical protein
MADDLKIGRHFFHKKKELSHYDIPVKRIKEITDKCDQVLPGWKDMANLIKDQLK